MFFEQTNTFFGGLRQTIKLCCAHSKECSGITFNKVHKTYDLRKGAFLYPTSGDDTWLKPVDSRTLCNESLSVQGGLISESDLIDEHPEIVNYKQYS